MRIFQQSLIILLLIFCSQQPAAADSVRVLSYEVTSSIGVDLPKLTDATYPERIAFAEIVLGDVVPDVIKAIGLDPTKVETDIAPGGYNLETHASLHSRVVLSEADGDRFAAALGYVFRTFSVLVSKLDDPAADTGYVVVTLKTSAINANLAQSFFVHAASVNPGLGKGYMALQDKMIFLNIRDDQGRPFSRLADATFANALRYAAGHFTLVSADVSATGKAGVRMIGNDWRAKPKGDDYVALLGGWDSPQLRSLDKLRERQVTLLLAAADRYHWR